MRAVLPIASRGVVCPNGRCDQVGKWTATVYDGTLEEEESSVKVRAGQAESAAPALARAWRCISGDQVHAELPASVDRAYSP